MSDNNEKISSLLIRRLKGDFLAEQEQFELQEWLQASSLHAQIAQDLIEKEGLRENMVGLLSKEFSWERIEATIQKKQEENILPNRRMNTWLTAAASILLVLGVGFYLWFQWSNAQMLPNGDKQIAGNNKMLEDIQQGREGAILTLADGSQVVLDSADNGVIALQNGSEVLLQNGQLVYEVAAPAAGKMVYNTMTTPKGRQFNLTLPDGTRVWLNAASSIRYPTVFSGHERRVEVQGEAYFEVAKNTKMPFRASIVNKAEVEVLGTSFNVNAYENEAGIYTTLLEGSIKVKVGEENTSTGHQPKERKEVILQPGHQALLVVGGQQRAPAIEIVHNADVDQVMAWKNGLFDFHSFGLEEVMRQLERWYDIDVKYESTVPDVKLKGKMTRDVALSGLLRNLGKLGVHCRLEGRTLVVLP